MQVQSGRYYILADSIHYVYITEHHMLGNVYGDIHYLFDNKYIRTNKYNSTGNCLSKGPLMWDISHEIPDPTNSGFPLGSQPGIVFGFFPPIPRDVPNKPAGICECGAEKTGIPYHYRWCPADENSR